MNNSVDINNIDNTYNIDNIDNTIKTITISGTGTKYEMKKVLKEKKEQKKRVDSEKWELTDEDLTYNKQIASLVRIQNNININNINKEDNLTKYDNLIISQIKTKLSSYKQQDILKKLLNEEKFITFNKTIDLLVESDLKCHYCSEFMNVVYEIVRMNKQWSLDRINNDLCHSNENCLIACLNCNLRRRLTNMEKFDFTKKLRISKQGV
jgi:hypothetical protein